MDQTWLIASGTVNGSGFSRTMRFLGFMRRFSSSSRYIRYTRLWFQPLPLTVRKNKKHSPKLQFRWLCVIRTSQSAISAFASNSFG